MGGKAVKDVRPLKQNEVQLVYEWVQSDIFPLIGITNEDACPIGSFGKKPLDETSGDVDIALSADVFINEGIEFSDIAKSINFILEEAGYETTFLKGFDQVSIKAPIQEFTNEGLKTHGHAQVDLMPVSDLRWAKFMYHSPNLKEGESKYKGAVRNALLMALISESTKEVTKLFEGKAEEYSSLAIRFPTGVWDIKRSFMGKKGKLVKKGQVLESEFITREPQDVVDLALGEGYGVGAANSFETLWEVIHRKDFIHKKRMNEIMSKFKVNLKSMRMETPEDALKKYPKIFESIRNDVEKKVKDLVTTHGVKKFEDSEFKYWYTKLTRNNPGANPELLAYSIYDRLNEEVIGRFGDPFDPVVLIKNPQTIKRFDSWVKGIIDFEGNLYIESIREDWLHKNMAEKLKEVGAIHFTGPFYENLDKFTPVYRLKDSNEFGLGEAAPKNESLTTLEMIRRANNKNPQFKFYNKFYDEFTQYRENITPGMF